MDFSMRRTWGPQPNIPLVQSYKRRTQGFIKIGGPCSYESRSSINEIAKHVAKCGATHLRAGVFRAGTFPGKSFGWLPKEHIMAFQKAAHDNGLQNIIELLDYTDDSFDMVLPYADCVQVGARSQQNYTLLRKVGALGKPVFLKRNPGSTLNEFLGSAEHILTAQKEFMTEAEVHLIERGSSTFENHTRWTLSISMIAAIKKITAMPVIIDASHGTGRRDLVAQLTFAGVAAGADGVLLETHPAPETSLSDPDQAVDLNEYQRIMNQVQKIREVLS